MFASKATCGFYDAAIHASMPEDVVEISNERHAQLLAGQSAGKVIGWDDQGFPVLLDPPPSFDERAVVERAWRDGELLVSDRVVARHRDELEAGAATTLSDGQYSELQRYRSALRNWPESEQFPVIEQRPIPPLWLPETQ